MEFLSCDDGVGIHGSACVGGDGGRFLLIPDSPAGPAFGCF